MPGVKTQVPQWRVLCVSERQRGPTPEESTNSLQFAEKLLAEEFVAVRFRAEAFGTNRISDKSTATSMEELKKGLDRLA